MWCVTYPLCFFPLSLSAHVSFNFYIMCQLIYVSVSKYKPLCSFKRCNIFYYFLVVLFPLLINPTYMHRLCYKIVVLMLVYVKKFIVHMHWARRRVHWFKIRSRLPPVRVDALVVSTWVNRFIESSIPDFNFIVIWYTTF